MANHDDNNKPRTMPVKACKCPRWALLVLVAFAAAALTVFLTGCAGLSQTDGSVPYYLDPWGIVGPVWTVSPAGEVVPGRLGSGLFGWLFGPAGASALGVAAMLVGKRSRAVLKHRVLGSIRSADAVGVVKGLLSTVGLAYKEPPRDAYQSLRALGERDGWLDASGNVIPPEAT